MTQKNRAALLTAAFLLLLLPLSCKTQENVKKNGEKILRGTVTIYGNEPHTWTGIETVPDGKIYQVNPPEKAAELTAMQGYVLEFTVNIRDAEIPGAAGTVTVISWRKVP
jgi:hypothetical protein